MHLSKLSKTLVLTGLLALAGAASAQKTQLLVYTALETDQIKAYQEGFNKVNPDIEIKWVRDSTGVITAKLLAEKANPQADVVMGVAASSLALLDKQGMLIPYAPLNLDAIMSQYRDKKSPPAWFGIGSADHDGGNQFRGRAHALLYPTPHAAAPRQPAHGGLVSRHVPLAAEIRHGQNRQGAGMYRSIGRGSGVCRAH